MDSSIQLRYERVKCMCLSFWRYFFLYHDATNKSSRSGFSYSDIMTSGIITLATVSDFCDERQSGVEEMWPHVEILRWLQPRFRTQLSCLYFVFITGRHESLVSVVIFTVQLWTTLCSCNETLLKTSAERPIWKFAYVKISSPLSFFRFPVLRSNCRTYENVAEKNKRLLFSYEQTR
jgi:hypothetical protein